MKKLLLSFLTIFFLFTHFLSAQTVLIDYNFNNYSGVIDSLPAGWNVSWNNTNASTGSYYISTLSSGPSGPNSYKFGLDDVKVITPQFQYADTVSFWIKGSSNIDTISTLIVVQTANGTDWDTIAIMNNLPTTGTIFKYKVNFNTIKLKFHYDKSVGNLAFDDFKLIQNKQVTADFATQFICLGDSSSFLDLSFTSGNTTITDWNWDFGNSISSIDQYPKHFYSAAGTYNVKLVVTDNMQFKDSISMQYYVYELPLADFAHNASPLCQNAEFVLTNNSVDPSDGTIVSWAWYFNDGSALNTSDWSPSHYFLIDGILEIKLIVYSSNEACSDTALSSVLVNEAPQADFNFSVNQQMVEFDGSVSTGSFLSYYWDFGDGNDDTNSNITHNYVNGGVYNACLTVTDSNGCEDKICKQINVSVTGIKSNEVKKAISVYPNPSVNGILSIDFSKYSTSIATVTVNNIIGSQVLKKDFSTHSIKKHVVDLSAQPAGNYFMTIRTDNEIITKKVVLNKR
ncbi:MAG: PKD domain-containing protein [Bacteroidetes bacterium]|nr:PKD domain-containing protein [Bacteroidota bacterium]HET6245940.1 PKD domain-containing protein [Bacteroidia bacterium]